MVQKITNPADLLALQKKAQADIELRSGQKDMRITVHMGTCGIAAGARDVLAYFVTELSRAQVQSVSLQRSGCAGLCDQEPMITLADKAGNEFRYGKMDKDKVREIVDAHVVAGSPVTKYLIQT
ncbi:MAG TPA: (2Fe-2S) ferredoxin domain-containing protein [bacterium]|nr:(2Fe-2S) ferredoxin domain-containing protein [bacterium]